MSPPVALTVCLTLLVALLWFDPAREPHTSLALWVPVMWLFIGGSRLPSQWIGGQTENLASAMEEGNPTDRTVYSVLIVLAIGILVSRSFKWADFFARNMALTAFLAFGLLSTLWSDYSFIAFKRWIRDLGDYGMILVILSDRRPLYAARTVLRRVTYLLIPLSILLIKYYTYLGMMYDRWTGVPEYVGVATTKNTLGGLCLVAGLALFWDTLMRWPERRQRRTRRIILLNACFLAMTIWLLKMSNSATSRTCFILGCLVIAAAHSRTFQRHPMFLKALLPVSFLVYLIVSFGLGMSGELAGSIGRDSTFTGRTVIWDAVLRTQTNPLLGTGYESFWLGPRLSQVWALTGPGIQEAHDGYLDIYLNLGLIGLLLLLFLLIACYRTICKTLPPRSNLGSFAAAMWTILIFYNVTEAGFKNGMMWTLLMLGTIVPPKPRLSQEERAVHLRAPNSSLPQPVTS
jgi:exopolysaccharide production protein ExoQ